MPRVVVVVAVVLVGAVLVGSAGPAWGKGEGRGTRVGVTISGPGLPGGGSGPGGPGSGNDRRSSGASLGTISVNEVDDPEQGAAFWQLAGASLAFTGWCQGCLAGLGTTPPVVLSRLGPVYRVVYFAGRCCKRMAVQTIYPYAAGGPWVDMEKADPRAFFGDGRNGFPRARIGWLHLVGLRGVALLDVLHHLGLPKENPVRPATGSVASVPRASGPSGTGWRIPVAIAALVALLLIGSAVARPRGAGRPA